MRITLVCLLAGLTSAAEECKLGQPFPWAWQCQDGACVRHDAEELDGGTSLNRCKLTCGADSQLWPRPTGPFSVGNATVSFRPASVSFSLQAADAVMPMLREATELLRLTLAAMMPGGGGCLAGLYGRPDPAAAERPARVLVYVEKPDTRLSLDTSEFYQLLASHTADDEAAVVIYADTFFGARHALETLSQLVNYDDVSDALQLVTPVKISDAPVYPIRALTLDTARNFVSLAGLRRTVDAMAMNKLNTLHWHITDTHSFPIQISREPRMARYGAYSPREVYTTADVRELVLYARQRGVRLLPELDAPAHVGYGWQWGEKAGLGNLTACLGREPWQSYCVEPPCGQMNVVNENLYPVLEKILTEYQELFQPDMFHMGGDEINLNCWKTTPEISDYVRQNGGDPDDDEEYLKLWIKYQQRVRRMWRNITERAMPLILWTSDLTKRPTSESGLDPATYILQVWSKRDDEHIGALLRRGYKLILSNYDAWYLDCGFSAWVGGGNNWCSPYKSWQTVYDNSPRRIARAFQPAAPAAADAGRQDQAAAATVDLSRQILGGAAALWSEQADDQTLDTKLWPRAAALAERLWAEPESGHAAAEARYLHHRRRMVARGIGAETVQPEFCHHYDGSCYID